MEEFWASVSKMVAGAEAYVTDETGRALLVKPSYRDHWGFAGGLVDLFDCGDLDAEAPLVLRAGEVDDCAFFTLEEAKAVLSPPAHLRLCEAAEARTSGATVYQVAGD